MFRVYRFDIKPYLIPNSVNTIEIRLYSPAKYCKLASLNYKYQVPLWEYPNGVHHRNFIRKCACHFGWDWGPCFCPIGIYKDIYIDFSNIPRVESIQIHTESGVKDQPMKEGSKSLVNIKLQLSEVVKKDSQVRFEIYGPDSVVVYSNSATIPLGEKLLLTTAEVQSSRLWWPNGYGEQPLYKLIIGMDDDILYNEKFGLRTVQLDTSKDQHGNKFQFVVNGVPVFAKGADWIPIDHFITRITNSKYKYLLESVKVANMNCLRVWGGGIYESDYFYQLCDEYGILLWQDFMFGCALYPTNTEFLNNVKEEVKDQVRRIGNHPCLALWCGSNESEQAIIEKLWDPIKANPQRYTIDYNQLYIETIQPVLEKESPNAFYWPSSPSNGVGEWGDCNDDTRGDTHYWAVWHSDMPFTQYLKCKSRFLSEFGFQSLPSYHELKGVVSDESQLNITSPEMEGRQRSPKPGNLGILRHIGLHFRIPNSFRGMCYISQILQAISIKAGCEHWRRMRPYCMGTLYWQLNDIWVGPSWSSIEYNGGWKALHYFAKKFYEPLLLSFNEPLDNADQLEVWVTNDKTANISKGTEKHDITVKVLNIKDSTIFKTLTYEQLEIPLESSKCYSTLKKSELFNSTDAKVHANYIVLATLDSGKEKQENIYYPVPFKHFNLQSPNIQLKSVSRKSDDVMELVLESSNAIALFVWVETTNHNPLKGYFSDNGFILLKKQPLSIYFNLSTPNVDIPQFIKQFPLGLEGLFSITSLVSSYN
ncbi:beta-mannosidase [Tieghemostelium lacteum]|uniref:Beta-mannosidase B n=1 Tax=Tieghemostelium lacteum TaxID=361077 RepID=A0A151ZGK3_TIELA|nr:beta-mannosidase [Tieghemostelium lacteum]|eukprot:KYQ93101.1 beta-mannosidase [Tieghemostelium lacteum]